MNFNKSILSIALSVAAVMFVGCSTDGYWDKAPIDSEVKYTFNQRSDTVLPVAQQTAERFMALNPDARITVTGGGTGVGISALLDGTTDIAMASRPIKFSEKMKVKSAGKEVEEVIVAYDALAVVVHPSNPVKQLTRQQLEDIFRGKITNWKQVGGDDRKIVVYSRETSSGTYEFFKESFCRNALRRCVRARR